jgi:putative tricarboxylic transport membrane protein
MLFDMLASLQAILASPGTLALLVAGSLIGILFSALPGLNATLGVAVMLPLTFSLQPGSGIGFLTSIYIGAMCGGLFAATLLRIPGNASSIATTFDGYPLAQKGQPVKALATGVWANFVGGILGLIALVAFAPVIARFALAFGPFEMTSLTIMATMLVVSLAQGAMIKGLLAALLGMACGLVGFAPIDGTARYTFGVTELTGGFGVVPVIVGLFAIAQILREVHRAAPKVALDLHVRGTGVTRAEVRANLWNMLRSSAIGVWIGVLPGIGASASSIVAWAMAKRASRDPGSFGKGNVAGIWASETSNNANVGGSLLPLLTLGIPGDAVTALMIAGFMIHGLQPGPLLFREHSGIVADIYASYLVSTVAVLLFQLATLRIFPRILLVPHHYLLPVMLTLTVIGAYAADNQTFDVWVMFAFGALALVLERYGFSLAAFVLGFLLGPILELNLRRALTYEDGDLTPFLTRPISATMLALTVVALGFILLKQRRGGLRYADD